MVSIQQVAAALAASSIQPGTPSSTMDLATTPIGSTPSATDVPNGTATSSYSSATPSTADTSGSIHSKRREDSLSADELRECIGSRDDIVDKDNVVLVDVIFNMTSYLCEMAKHGLVQNFDMLDDDPRGNPKDRLAEVQDGLACARAGAVYLFDHASDYGLSSDQVKSAEEWKNQFTTAERDSNHLPEGG